MTCDKHKKEPDRGYSECAGCEIERLTADYMAHERMIAGYVDELARLRAENERMREALGRIAAGVDCPEGVIERPDFYASQDYFEHIANEALAKVEQKPETCVWTDRGATCTRRDTTYCPFCGKRVEVKE